MRCNSNELNISNCQVFDNFFKMMIIIIRYNNKSQITLDGNIIIIIIIIKHCFVFKVTFTFTSYVHHLVMQNINIKYSHLTNWSTANDYIWMLLTA